MDGDAADAANTRRANLAKSLAGVVQAFAVAAAVLEAHAEVLRWAQGRAVLAIELWEAGVEAAAAAGVPTLTLRPQAPTTLGPRPAFPESDPGAVLRRSAEHVLAMAQREVHASAAAVAEVLDGLSEGLPDGNFHLEEFFAGIGDWFEGLWRLSFIRFAFDYDGTMADRAKAQEGMEANWDRITDDPSQIVPTVFDAETWHDNPGRWWGRAAPGLALLAWGGAGLADRLAMLARLQRAGLDVGDVAVVGDDIFGPGGRWSDPAARQTWVDDLPTTQPQRPVPTNVDWGKYQIDQTGPVETQLSGSGTKAWVDGVVVDSDRVAAADVKFITTPGSSLYTGTMPAFLQEKALAKIDDQLLRYRGILDDPGNPVGRFRLITNDPQAAQYLLSRAQQIFGPGAEIVVEVRP